MPLLKLRCIGDTHNNNPLQKKKTLTNVCVKVDQTGGLIITGFEDGVVRLLELYDPHKLAEVHHERRPIGEAKLRLKQAFKPHNEPVTAVAFDLNGIILATGVRYFSLKKHFFS